MRRTSIAATATALVFASVLGTALAQQSAMLPPEQRSGMVSWVTGGIAAEESAAFRAAAPRYALSLEFGRQARPIAEHLSDVGVVIMDASGTVLLNTRTDGPFLLAQLPPGRYEIRAEHENRMVSREVQITSGINRHLLLVW